MQIVLNGRVYENAASVKERLGIKEMTLWRSIAERGMPKPIKLGKSRYFDRELIDQWAVGQIWRP
jgi:predicted DNA-binding transcriptional regulator AlpA